MKSLFELVYLIHEGRLTTQREFSKSLFLSLGKVNSLVREGIEKGFIESGDSYTVTDKGVELLEQHRVDNAVIMAAGFGSRFVPLTYERPKGLLEVHGEVMIERQIKQLHEVGIKDITVVVGYLKEKFEYLTDKYGVKLVYNPDYSFKNNISSLYHAREEMKNSYILPSDIYMPKNIFRKYEYESFYAVEYFEEYTDEWAVKLNKDNLILDVNPRGDKKTWAMSGPAFFTKEFGRKLLGFINEIYDVKPSYQWFWEDVYMRHPDELKLYARKYKKGTILEFETLEELRQHDKSYLKFSRSDILETIMEVFGVELSEIVGINTLKEGMTNDSFLFEVNGKRYVFRNPGIGTEELINRSQEAAVYELIKPLGITDNVIYLEPNKGYKIAEFIPDSRHINMEEESEVKLALGKIRLLHNSGIKTSHDFDIEERIDFYLNLCKETNAILFNDFDQVHEEIKKVLENLKSIPREKVLCHIDSIYANFLYKDGDVTLLDWEYSGMADPLIDIAMYVVYGGLQDDEIVKLLNLYLERDHTAEELMIVHSYVALAGFLWSMWTQYKQAQGEDFGTYGMGQYQYARKYSRIVLKELEKNA